MSLDIASAAVDYITVTTKNVDFIDYLVGEGVRLAEQAVQLGDVTKKAGFQGYAGRRTGPVFWGVRHDGALLVVSGAAAQGACELLDWERVKPTRIDLQVTVRYRPHRPFIARALNELMRERLKLGLPDVPPSPVFIDRHGRGDQFTVGVRSSPRYGRIYDKQEESGSEAYLGCWRYEVEYKRICAVDAVRRCAEAGWSAETCIGLVAAQYAAWHIFTPFGGGTPIVLGSIGRRDADAERTLRWLRTQVAPSIEKLHRTATRDEIIEALGLTHDGIW